MEADALKETDQIFLRCKPQRQQQGRRPCSSVYTDIYRPRALHSLHLMIALQSSSTSRYQSTSSRIHAARYICTVLYIHLSDPLMTKPTVQLDFAPTHPATTTMPPRIWCPSSSPLKPLTSNPPTSCALVPIRARSAFLSTTPAQLRAQTKARREFYEWLNGPGTVFLQPPHAGKTNYLGAYDVRTGQPKEEKHWRSANLPFPLNPVFPSTPVVSDELANEVYYRVVVAGKSVRMVSAELSVSLQRVAAIVRLKTIEKRWENDVSLLRTLQFTTPDKISMMNHIKNRLVLKTPTWLQTLRSS